MKRSASEALNGQQREPKRTKVLAKTKFLFADDDLKCIVCLDFSEGHIFQCSNGHILCVDCNARIIEGNKAECPVCKVRLNRRYPTRNRLAEKYLAAMMVECTNEACKVKTQYGNLKHHLKEECAMRHCLCKYSTLGCDWKGLYKDRKSHRKDCAIRNCSVNRKDLKMLNKNVKKLDKGRRRTEEGRKMNSSAELKVVNLLSSRFRSIEIRDIVISKNELYERMSSATFTAVSFNKWEAFLETVEEQNTKLGLRLEIVTGRPKKRINCILVILCGPQTNLKFRPITVQLNLNSRRRKSDLIILPISSVEASRLQQSQEAINLRFMFFDQNSGLDGTFSSDQATYDESEDETSSSDLSLSASPYIHVSSPSGTWFSDDTSSNESENSFSPRGRRRSYL